MKHLGDITKLNGAEIPVVDCITGGSPCQDLSVAGARAGLEGERSGLFMEQLRIVKEMRKREQENGRADELVRPRFMVWENVPGAFSSNGGKDFRTVLTEIVRIVEPECPDVPMPDRGGWSKAGCLYDELGRWSVAWRVHDAQFWGVPQRRKRIALVADFAGMCAPEVLFERKGLSRDTEPCEAARQGTAARTETGVGAYSFQERAGKPGGARGSLFREIESGPCQPSITKAYSIQGNTIDRDAKQNGGGISSDVAHTLNGVDRHGIAIPSHAICSGFSFGQSEKARSIGYQEEVSPTLRGGEGGNQKPCVYDARGNGDGETVCTITGDHQNRVTDYTALCIGNGQANQSVLAYGIDQQGGKGGANYTEDVCPPILSDSHGTPHAVAYGVGCDVGGYQNRVTDYTALCVGNGQLNQISMAEQANTLDTMHDQQAVMVLNDQGGGVMDVSNESTATLRAQTHGHEPVVVAPNIGHTLKAKANCDFRADSETYPVHNGVVRRLTPLECERLQGYPDGWTDIGEWTDTKGKKHKESDSPRYKALGNSIALPFWFYLLRRISATYERPATLGSLFDGIGGFPLCWERCNGKGTAVWASEIEEFPIAVTKIRFPE